jgi:hypothetical protein
MSFGSNPTMGPSGPGGSANAGGGTGGSGQFGRTAPSGGGLGRSARTAPTVPNMGNGGLLASRRPVVAQRPVSPTMAGGFVDNTPGTGGGFTNDMATGPGVAGITRSLASKGTGAPPTSGPIPPGPYPNRPDGAPPGTPIGTGGWEPTPPITAPNPMNPASNPPAFDNGPVSTMPGAVPTNTGFTQAGGQTGGQSNTINQATRQGLNIDGEELASAETGAAKKQDQKGTGGNHY